MTYRVLDLFSGIGGFSLGLERTGGFETVAFCEIDPFCRRVLAKHWPKVPRYEDVRELTADRLATDGIAVDVICGGFPCQDLSRAGKRSGLEGERSGLWSEVSRLVRELRPDFVIVENVPELNSFGLGRVLGDLADVGYDAEWDGIPAAAVGSPQLRARTWLLAYPAGVGDGLASGSFQAGRGVTQHGAWWDAEPAVGRVANGVPAELDGANGAIQEHDPQGRAQGDEGRRDMSGVWGDGSARAPSPGLRQTRGSRGSLPSMSRQGGSTGRDAKGEAAEELHDLRRRVHADAQQEAHNLQPGVSSGGGPAQCREALGWSYEPDVPRVAHGVPARVDRLRALGNAVVPQIPELIGRAILAAEAERLAA